jgi:xylulokinase
MGDTIGIDIGTTGARSVRINGYGRIVASSIAPYPLIVPRSGWTEQDPLAWWDAVRTTLHQVVAAGDAPIDAIGAAGQMHGAVFLNERCAPIRPALLWNDQRTAKQVEELRAAVGETRLREITGNAALTGFQAPKILWLREHEPENYACVRHVLLPKDYIRFRLTGTLGAEPSDASGTLLFDLARRTWSQEILRALDLPAAWFPQIFESPEIVGLLDEKVASEIGATAGIPVVAGAGDNAAAAVASGVVRCGSGMLSLGTSGVIVTHDNRPRIDPTGALHAFCAALPGAYHLVSVTLSAGGSLRWFRDAFGRADESFDDIIREAANIEPGADGVVFLPYLAGERTPHMDPDVRGAWLGLGLAHGRPHLIRALLEGVAFGLADGVERMRALGVDSAEFNVTGKGMQNPVWRDIIAATFGRPLHRLLADEGPAFGAALLAAVGAGRFPSVESASDAVVAFAPEPDHPTTDRIAAYRATHKRFQGFYPAIRGMM